VEAEQAYVLPEAVASALEPRISDVIRISMTDKAEFLPVDRNSLMIEAPAYDPDEENADGVTGRTIWMEGDYVVSGSGKRWMKEEFVCTVTGKPLVDDPFVMKDDLPYSRKAYIDMFGEGLCAGCVEPLQKGEDVVSAVNYFFHSDCFVCAHTGKNLPIYEPYFEYDGLPYCLEAYLELFQACGKCLQTVPLEAESDDPECGVSAFGKVGISFPLYEASG
jgi:hypothetical protein